MDWFVLLTPLLIFAVILLLGFAGCDVIFRLDDVVLPLYLKVRVPVQFTVITSRFRWTPMGKQPDEKTNLPSTPDGPDFVILYHSLNDNPLGGWEVECSLEVNDGTAQASAMARGSFTLDEDGPSGTALFETTGSPAGNDFGLRFFPGFTPSD